MQRTLALKKRLKELEKLVGKVNVEVNSVETSASVGAVSGSDAEFVKKFGNGDVPLSKENVARYNKIKEKYD